MPEQQDFQPEQNLPEGTRRILAEFAAARVQLAAKRANSARRSLTLGGVLLKVGLVFLCLGILALRSESCFGVPAAFRKGAVEASSALDLAADSFYQALLDWPYWMKMIAVLIGGISLSVGLTQLVWSLREMQGELERQRGSEELR